MKEIIARINEFKNQFINDNNNEKNLKSIISAKIEKNPLFVMGGILPIFSIIVPISMLLDSHNFHKLALLFTFLMVPLLISSFLFLGKIFYFKRVKNNKEKIEIMLEQHFSKEFLLKEINDETKLLLKMKLTTEQYKMLHVKYMDKPIITYKNIIDFLNNIDKFEKVLSDSEQQKIEVDYDEIHNIKVADTV